MNAPTPADAASAGVASLDQAREARRHNGRMRVLASMARLMKEASITLLNVARESNDGDADLLDIDIERARVLMERIADTCKDGRVERALNELKPDDDNDPTSPPWTEVDA